MYTDEEEEAYVLSSKYINKQIFLSYSLTSGRFLSPSQTDLIPTYKYIFLTLSAWMERKSKTKQITFIAWERAKTFIKKSNSPSHFKCNLCTIPTEIWESPICVRWWVERRGQHGL